MISLALMCGTDDRRGYIEWKPLKEEPDFPGQVETGARGKEEIENINGKPIVKYKGLQKNGDQKESWFKEENDLDFKQSVKIMIEYEPGVQQQTLNLSIKICFFFF